MITIRYFTSDLHFGHENIIAFCERPFWSVQEMNARMTAKWNEIVQREDEVIVVGDLALGKIEDSLEWASKLNGKKFLIPGNHDRCWRGNGKWAQWELVYEAAGFTILPSSIHLEIAGQEVEVCHFPFAGNENPNRSRPDKFSGNRPDDVGQLLIHGHVHDAWTTKGRMMNVGVDVWDFYPVAEDWVADWVQKEMDERTVRQA